MVTLQNQDGDIKSVPTGYSWTTLFFGFFPALFRGDFKSGILLIIIDGVLALLPSSVFGWTVFGLNTVLFNLLFAGFYNKLYIGKLLIKGFTGIDDINQRYIRQQGLLRWAAGIAAVNMMSSMMSKDHSSSHCSDDSSTHHGNTHHFSDTNHSGDSHYSSDSGSCDASSSDSGDCGSVD